MVFSIMFVCLLVPKGSPVDASTAAERYSTLEFWHTWVGVNYVVLSFAFVLVLGLVWKVLNPMQQDVEWPTWWVKVARPVMFAVIVGTSMFLFGCGIHHFHEAQVILPQAEENAIRATKTTGINYYDISVFVGRDHYPTHLVLQVTQAIGGTLLMMGGLVMSLAVHRSRRVRQRPNIKRMFDED